MHCGRSSVSAGLLLVTVLLTSCSRNNPGDVFPGADAGVTPTSGPDSFLLFPNPQKQADGSLQTNTSTYATAYYSAVDPSNARDTLDKWKTANHFGNAGMAGTETWVVFGDVKDLGYGRRMTARSNSDGTIAVMVENYLVSPVANYTYSSLNLDAAVNRDQRWHVGTNGIEYSPPPTVAATLNCGNCYAKFFTFDPVTGQRLLVADLDGRGDKAMPGICISCHGGRADPLKFDGTFPRSVTSFPGTSDASPGTVSGDVQAHLQPLEVGTFDFSSTPGYSRADQEAKLKTINKLVLCSYPLPTGTTSTDPDDACRPVAGPNSWQGTAAEMIKSWYGDTGSGLQNTFSDTYVPQTDTFGAGWAAATGQTVLYQNVIAKSCRVCHVLRGTVNMDEINFRSFCLDDGTGACNPTYPGYFFIGYADRVKAHVIDRGNMPLGRLIYERFWNSTQPDTLATFLESQSQTARDSGGAVLVPGRPIADPGPDRTTISGATLSAANSLFASTYNWSVSSGGVLSNPTSAQTTLTGPNGTYVVQLVVGNGTTQSAPVTVNVTIATVGSPELPIEPVNIHFADIKAILQGSLEGCTGCHTPGDPQVTYEPPIFYTDYDRNGSGAYESTDDPWFYNDLRGRINFTDVAASPLLRKPSGHHHGGGTPLDTTNTTACSSTVYPLCSPYAKLGDYYKAQYNKIVLWILNGAPY